MRYSNVLSGVAAVLLALSAGMVTAAQRDAAAKALGDMQGRPIPRQMYRAFSYAPANVAAAPATEEPQATSQSAPTQNNAARSFSYQPAPSNYGMQMNRRVMPIPGFLRADRKARGDY